MKETPTPRKNLSYRRPKDSPSTKSTISDHSKKSHQIAKKNLDSVFSSVSEDVFTDSVTGSFDFSLVSENLSDININHNGESIDSFESLFAEGEALTSSDSSASSKITTVNDDTHISSHDCDKVFISDSNVEANVVANLLKQARVEVSSSNVVSCGSKKLLDSLVEVYVKEFCGLPGEKELANVLISEKTRVLVFCFAVWLITMTVIVIVSHHSSNQDISSFYSLPT